MDGSIFNLWIKSPVKMLATKTEISGKNGYTNIQSYIPSGNLSPPMGESFKYCGLERTHPRAAQPSFGVPNAPLKERGSGMLGRVGMARGPKIPFLSITGKALGKNGIMTEAIMGKLRTITQSTKS